MLNPTRKLNNTSLLGGFLGHFLSTTLMGHIDVILPYFLSIYQGKLTSHLYSHVFMVTQLEVTSLAKETDSIYNMLSIN